MTRRQKDLLDKMNFHMGQVQSLAQEFSEDTCRRVISATYTDTGIPLFLLDGGKDEQLVVEETDEHGNTYTITYED